MSAHNPDSMRTLNAVVRHLGAARSGTMLMWAQRFTSAMLMLLTVCFVFVVWSLVGKDYMAVREVMSRPFPAVVMLAYMLIISYHMMIGMRVIIDDYVQDKRKHEWSLIANMIFCGAIAFFSAYAILKIAFV